MPRAARKFVLALTDEEKEEIHCPPLHSQGGRQSLERKLYNRLQVSNNLEVNDAEIGEILRVMGGGGYDKNKPAGTGGGLQKRLHKALGRAIKVSTGL